MTLARAVVVAALSSALASSALASAGCATTPVAFTVSTNVPVGGTVPADPEVWSRGSALQLHFELTNQSQQRYAVCVCAAAVHVESITRDGERVQPTLLDVNVIDDARAFFAQQMQDLEPERELALQTDGVAEGHVDHDQWQLYGYKLMRGRYRVVFSYQYDGPDYGRQNVFHGRVVAPPVTFTVE